VSRRDAERDENPDEHASTSRRADLHPNCCWPGHPIISTSASCPSVTSWSCVLRGPCRPAGREWRI